jgi:sulfite reductase alpha subunit-like flavoprotein
MEKNKEEVITTLFDNGGYLYVCGDAKNMAKNVREVVTRCVEAVKGKIKKKSYS